MAPFPLVVRTLAVLGCLSLCAAMHPKKAVARVRLQSVGVERAWAAPAGDPAAFLPRGAR